MTKSHLHPPAPEDLPELYLDLLRRLERLEGIVQQLRALGTGVALNRPTWRDIEPMLKDIRPLQEEVGLDDE